MKMNSSHWVACWGNATSITDRKESVYAKDITIRYPIRICFDGNKIRLRFSNLTGTEDVTLTRIYVTLKKQGDLRTYIRAFLRKRKRDNSPRKGNRE